MAQDTSTVQVSRRTDVLMAQGYSCSEAIAIAVSEHVLGSASDELRRIATPFGGGVGGTQQELCGALSGGVLLIGLLHGRTQSDQDNMVSRQLAALYRERFERTFGATCCQDLLNSGYGTGGISCRDLTAQAALVLLETLEA
jgi:C_GCAxxG_C_C family probable redox protein